MYKFEFDGENDMLRRLGSARDYMDFITEINSNLNFSNPSLCTEEQMKCNLLNAENNQKTHYIFGVFEDQKLIGLFIFLL